MRLSYHHANPGGGNESFLLRYQPDPTEDGGVCVLVDAGDEIQLDRILRPEDELVGICLTHAHLDHYQSLDTCRREETTIYASEPTAAILEDVFDVAARDYGVTTTDATTRAIEAIDGWTDLSPGFAVHPIPAGHVPGAVGYLFRLDDGEETRHVLATGDFTERRAAGFPGVDASSYLDIDVLFLTVATDTDFERNLSDGLARALQRAHSGSRTLVATSGLLGVQAAYLLDELTTEFERAVPIRVVGQVAKLYETLDYDCPRVETIPFFEDPEECLARGTITIAGPEVPHERSSGRLFGLLRSDPSACVIQFLGSGEDPLEEGNCTIDAYTVVNHPTRETINEVHDAIDPHYAIVVHRHRGAGSEYNDLNSVVWSPTDADEYTLYEDGQWIAPPWMSTSVIRPSTASNMGQLVGDDILGALSIPSLNRHETVDLEAEGLVLDRVDQILSQQAAYDYQPEDAEQAGGTDSEERTPEAIAPDEGEPIPMTFEEQETTDSSETATPESADTKPTSNVLVDTTNVGVDGIDQQILTAIKAGELDIEDIVQAQRVAERQADPTDVEEPVPEEEGALPTAHEQAPENKETTDGTGETDSEVADSTGGETAAGDSTTVDDESPASGTDPSESDSDSEQSPDTDDDTTATVDGEISGPSANTELEPTLETGSDTVELTLSPLTVALATVASNGAEDETREQFVSVAVREYLRGLLDGTITDPGSSTDGVLVEGGASLDLALETVVEQTDEFENVSELLTRALAGAIAPDAALETTLIIPGLPPYLPLVDAIIENDRYPVTSRREVVAVAVRHRVADL